MNILIDCLSLVRKNGAAEYLRRIIDDLLKRTETRSDVTLYGVYDAVEGIAYDDAQPECMEGRGIKMVDVSNTNLVELTERYSIDTFFIGCVQVAENYKELKDLKCKVIVVVHDLAFEETHREDIDIYHRAQNKSTASLINWLLLHKKKSRTHSWYIVNTVKLLSNNPKAEIVAVSNYTKNSILYAYDVQEDRIHVWYSPERIYTDADNEPENPVLASLCSSGKQFMLLLGTQHPLKNTRKAVHAFQKFAERHPEYYLVTTGKMLPQQFPNHIPLPFLSDNDLQQAYRYCCALIYPTLFEGFGYPPVEVMRYGKPVLASNIGPVREVLADAPLYFSPLYETDIYQALSLFAISDYSTLQKASTDRYKEISARQQADLEALLHSILSNE